MDDIKAIAAEIRASLGGEATNAKRRRWAIELETLAQQHGAVDEVTVLRGLLDEVRSHFTRDDDLPDDLLPRIDAALDHPVPQ